MNARRVVSWILVAVLLAAVWHFLVPRQLGGLTSYVTVDGNSMEPTISKGDLVALRHQDGYAVGDIVAYRSDMAGALVLHRIVGRDGDRFVLQGDNNDFLDRYQPTNGDVLGRQVLRFPGASSVTDALGSLTYLVLATSVAVVLVVLAAFSSNNHERRRRRRRTEEVIR